MPDVYATIADADPAIQERLAGILEMRAAHPQQRAMLDSYLSEIEFPHAARVLEIGCGTGSVTRVLAGWPSVAEVVGIDPSPVFIAKACALSTMLCHIPQPECALQEAFRVLRSSGVLAVFDGDYSTITVALGQQDPLQNCAEAMKDAFLNDVWLVRRLPRLLQSTGFQVISFRSHGFLQTSQPEYMLSLIDRGADTLVSWGRIGRDMGASLKAEARRRADAGEFFGFIGFASLIARKAAN